MSFSLKYYLFILLFILTNSEIEYSSCENNIRKLKFENGDIKEFPCITCPKEKYTKYNESEEDISCFDCISGMSNYGPNIILNSFTEKKLSRYNISSLNNNDIKKSSWKINPLSLKADCGAETGSCCLDFTFNQYYMNNGELIIKYINYNGGIGRYFNIFINDKLIYKDDSENSIVKKKKFNVNKGPNKITFQYIVTDLLFNKGKIYDDDYYIEIFEIQMINAETSSLECEKYNDTIEDLKNTLHNNCDYYVNKCSEDDICTFRFYSEVKSEYCNYLEGTRNISYIKINDSNCDELLEPVNKEDECGHCTYGQYLSKKDEIEAKCEYCNSSNYYNSKIINDKESCNEECDIDNKQLNKILYYTYFEDPSEFTLDNITIILSIGYIEVNYEKFNEREDCNIFIEISNLDTNDYKTIELINPDDNNIISDYYSFNIPIEKGIFSLKIKGKNLKLNKISIKGTEFGGNYRCVDKLNTNEEETCPNENEHFSPIQNGCINCTLGSTINYNKECAIIEQFIDNKFTLDINMLINSEIFSSPYTFRVEGESEIEYKLNFNPVYPLLYYYDYSNHNSFIIGKELYKIKLVKGINNRGIILSYRYNDNKKYITNLFVKCNTTISDENQAIILNNIEDDTENDIKYFFFTLESKESCPYCLDSEVTYIDNDNKCIQSKKLIDIEIKNTSLCVIKPYDNTTESKLVNDTNILLNKNSTEIEDKLLISYYDIDEDIPINYEKEDDEINTLFKKNISCEYERKSITDMGTGVLILIIIAGVLILLLLGVIIWKCISLSKKKEDSDDLRESLSAIELKNVESKANVIEEN